MNDANPADRWQVPWQRAEAAPSTTPAEERTDDPADLGTAFGLDLSLAPAEGLPSDRHHAADEPARR